MEDDTPWYESAWDYVTDTDDGLLSDVGGFLTDNKGKLDTRKIAGLVSTGATVADIFGLLPDTNRPTGYQGSIPNYTAVRAAVPESPQPASVEDYALMQQYQYDPNRRPGSSGRRYFSDVMYTAPDQVASTRERAERQAEGLAMLNRANPARRTVNPPVPVPTQAMAQGGIAGLYGRRNPMALNKETKGYYLGGPTDGMADAIPAQIDNKQPAALSDGEFVIPADVVSHLGNGNSNAGAQQLYSMMDRIRQARTGTAQQGKQVNPNTFTPA